MSLRQLVVAYTDDTTVYYPVSKDRGWRIDHPSRCLVIGRGLPRTYIPLDTVRSFDIAHVATSQPPLESLLLPTERQP